ncbi:putative oxidoreductase [Raoultella ornithinolytica]|nr:putative oxidoreductase [Raoultella ornithinolytica]
MEQRRVYGKNHWYHETQSTICPVDVLPLVPEAAHVEDRFLLDLTLPEEWLHAHAGWLTPSAMSGRRALPCLRRRQSLTNR